MAFQNKRLDYNISVLVLPYAEYLLEVHRFEVAIVVQSDVANPIEVQINEKSFKTGHVDTL